MSVVLLGSTSGSITLQEPAVAGSNTVNFGANTGVAILDANSPGFRNRLINGSMVLDQRNEGASVTPISKAYTLDRWAAEMSAASKYSVQQNAGAVTPPTGFSNYLGATSTATTSLGATDFYAISQAIEGFNIADLAWGTANAQTITISFWVRSSLTGTFGGALNNNGSSRSYPFTYTISAANTWEQKSVTIAGDTSGTWLTTSGVGLYLVFGLGCGTTRSGTAGAWNSNWNFSATGAVSVVGTNGATFYITGVQFEKGSTATAFDDRSYGQELQLAQRYFEGPLYYDVTGAHISVAAVSVYGGGFFQVRKRTSSPTITFSTSATFSSANGNISTQASGGAVTSRTASVGSNYFNMISIQCSGSDPRGNGYIWASTEL